MPRSADSSELCRAEIVRSAGAATQRAAAGLDPAAHVDGFDGAEAEAGYDRSPIEREARAILGRAAAGD